MFFASSSAVIICICMVNFVLGTVNHGHGSKHSQYGGGGGYDEKPTPFKFGYDIRDDEGNTQSHKEEADSSGARRGSYSYKLANGIYRIVDYVADHQGFRATIRTNEPGTDNASPADVNLQAETPSQSHYGSSRGHHASRSGSGQSWASGGSALGGGGKSSWN